MGRLAGQAMAGRTVTYDHLPFFYSDLFDLGYEAVGEEIEVMVLRVDVGERRIGLSRKQVSRTEASDGEVAAEASAAVGRSRRRELRGGTGSGTAQLFTSLGNAVGEEGESGVAGDRHPPLADQEVADPQGALPRRSSLYPQYPPPTAGQCHLSRPNSLPPGGAPW
jgi:hypothetical protein